MTKERLEEIRKQDESAHRRVEYEYGKDHDFPCPTCELLADLDRKNAVVEAARELITFFSITSNADGSLDPPVVWRLARAIERHDKER